MRIGGPANANQMATEPRFVATRLLQVERGGGGGSAGGASSSIISSCLEVEVLEVEVLAPLLALDLRIVFDFGLRPRFLRRTSRRIRCNGGMQLGGLGANILSHNNYSKHYLWYG